MTKIIGKNLEVGLAFESERGTAESSASKWIKNTAVNIIPQTEQVTDESSHNVLSDSDGRRVVRKWAEGDLEGNVQADPIGYLFHNIYGSVSSEEIDTSGVYTHEFTLDNSIQHPSLSIFAKDGGVDQKVFSGGMVNSLEINASTDSYVSYTANFMANSAESNDDTPEYDQEYDFIGKNVEVKIADSESELDDADPVETKELSITFETGVIQDWVLGKFDPADNLNAQMAITGSINKNYEDSTFEDLFNGDDSKYMQIKITGDADIGDGNNPEITIVLNRVRVTSWERSGGNDELVTEDVEFKAFYKEADDQQSKVTLTNSTESYGA